MPPEETKRAKIAAGKAAAALVEEGMAIGMGSGSTAAAFIVELGQRCRQGLSITAIAASRESEALARKEGIPIVDSNALLSLDLSVDGADEIDREKRMIKGGGGALLREKVIASLSKRRIIIVDPSKRVEKLGKFPVAVEILPFAHLATAEQLNALGFSGAWRMEGSGLFATDNGNVIYDIHFDALLSHPEEVDRRLKSVPGVLETGFFFCLCDTGICGYPDGRHEIF